MLGYLTILTNVINAQLMTILSFNKTMHRCILHSTQSNCYSAKLSTSFLLRYASITVQSFNSTDYEIQGVIQQHEHEL